MRTSRLLHDEGGLADAGNPPWGWRECAVGVGLAIAGLLVIVTILAVSLPHRNKNNQTVQDYLFSLGATLLFEAVLFAIAVALTAGRYGGGLRVLGWRPRRPGAWIGWTFFAVVAAYITLGVYAVVTNALGLKGLQPKSNVPNGLFDHQSTVVLATFLTVVAAPVVEESFFRGFLFAGLRRDYGFSWGATLSGCLFAIAHTSPGLIIPFTTIGVIFAFVYRRTGTLWTNVSAHMIFNLVSVVVTLTR